MQREGTTGKQHRREPRRSFEGQHEYSPEEISLSETQRCAPGFVGVKKWMTTSPNSALFGPSGLRPVLRWGDLLSLSGHDAPFGGCLGMYSVESRLRCFNPVLPTRSGSSSHIVTPVKGRVF